MTQIDVSRDATVMSVRLLGDADARSAWRVLDAIEAAVTIAPGLPIRIDLTGTGRISPAFAALLARIVHAGQGAGRAVCVLVPDVTVRAGPVGALLRPVASPTAVAM